MCMYMRDTGEFLYKTHIHLYVCTMYILELNSVEIVQNESNTNA